MGIVERNDDGNVTACNLDIKNPHLGDIKDHRNPGEIMDSIIERERELLGLMEEIKKEFASPL